MPSGDAAVRRQSGSGVGVSIPPGPTVPGSCRSQEQWPSPLRVLQEALPSHAAWLIPANHL